MMNHYVVRALTTARTRARAPVPACHLSSSSSSSSSSSTSPNVALKNVTKSNFEPALAELRRHVKEAEFVAIDLEMTGLTSAPWRGSFEFDRSDIRYLKVKDSAEKFAVVQFGVCPFRWDPHNRSFIAHPHNFYIFPRQEIQGECNSYEFLCQTTSLDFLVKHQFDFNLCVSEGVSYLSRSQEEDALRRLNAIYDDQSSDSLSSLREVSDLNLVRMSDVLFAERMKNKIGEWLSGLSHSGDRRSDLLEESNETNQKLQTIFFKMRPALVLNGFTSRQLRLIEQVARKHFKDLLYVHVTGEASYPQPLIVYTDSRTDRDLLMSQINDCRRKQAGMKIKAAVGFRHVIDLLASERKLIVGHNCFLDFAHIYSKFIGPLPWTAEEYASEVQKYFPCIIDTKVVLNSDGRVSSIMRKSSTTLGRAFAMLCPQIASGDVRRSLASGSLASTPHIKVDVQVDDQRFSNWNSGAKHEAGYDAFMTGCIFAQVCSHLGIEFNLPEGEIYHNAKLQKYVNHLCLSWTNGIDLRTGKWASDSLDSTNLKQLTPKFMFPNIVLLWGLQPTLKTRMMKECLMKVFGGDSVTSIRQLDETSAFVQFSKAEMVSEFLKLKESLERNKDPISVLHPLSKIFEGGCTRAASYELYKEICSSPLSEVLFTNQAEVVASKCKTRLQESFFQSGKQEEKASSFSRNEKGAYHVNIDTNDSSNCNLQLMIS